MSLLGYCIFINTVGEGTVSSVRGEGNLPCVFDTRLEAEKEIADLIIMRLQQFIDGECDDDSLEDVLTVEEYVVEVTVQPDGTLVDEDGRRFT